MKFIDGTAIYAKKLLHLLNYTCHITNMEKIEKISD